MLIRNQISCNTESNLKLIKCDISQFMFPPLSNFELTVESDYLSSFSALEQSKMTFKSKKKFIDSYYEGDVLDDKRHGLGRMFYDLGRYYFGEWRNDLREGRGLEQDLNSNNYKGSFLQGKTHGFEIFRWSNCEIYEDKWECSLNRGKAIWTSADGGYYISFWRHVSWRRCV
jgi:hypothetical protein